MQTNLFSAAAAAAAVETFGGETRQRLIVCNALLNLQTDCGGAHIELRLVKSGLEHKCLAGCIWSLL